MQRRAFTGWGKAARELALTRNVMHKIDHVGGVNARSRRGEMAALVVADADQARLHRNDLAPANRSPARGPATTAGQH